jgi:hypothetical protein
MEIKTYDHTDLQDYQYDEKFKCSFIADVVGDNPDIFQGDNNDVADKLKKLGAVGKHDQLDSEGGCFYIYFRTKEAGMAFLKKLSAYIRQKKTLLEKAEAF